MDFIEISAKTKEEAITKASIELGTSSDQLEIVVITEGSSGFLGIGSKSAVIKARRIEITEPETKEEPKKEAPAAVIAPTEEKVISKEEIKSSPKQEVIKPREEAKRPIREPREIVIITDQSKIDEITEEAKSFLAGLLSHMDLPIEVKVVYNSKDGSLDIEFTGEDVGILIGKRGQTLDSLQYLTSLVVNKKKDTYVRVKLDTEDYRTRRKETLENLARGIAHKVKKTGKTSVLEAMNPYERRIIHAALQKDKYVETFSDGEEPYRHVVVKLKK
ncbi:MAG: RNA-binding cell elongation regulator Jag/EloR [Lachnospiraceae bacterium]